MQGYLVLAVVIRLLSALGLTRVARIVHNIGRSEDDEFVYLAGGRLRKRKALRVDES
jgi:hypothetical protein